jgi:hypothetical protein
VRAEAAGRPIPELREKDFAFVQLAARLRDIRREVLHGRGFFLLRGVPVGRYTRLQAALAYWGIGTHLGEALSQNRKGHVLGHVQNLGLDYADPQVRGYQTLAHLPFHTDAGDVVALLCLRQGRSGGLSSIVSSTTVWNEMVDRRPELARALLEPVHLTRWGEIPAGRGPHFAIPVFAPWRGRMIATYIRGAVRKAQDLPDVPRIAQQQVDAMDLLDSLAVDPELRLDMAFRPGDVQLLNNHCVLHSRTAYEDWPEIERRRHLLRLWLACDDGPALPPHMTEAFQCATAGGRPNGVVVPGATLTAPLNSD